MKFEEGNDIKYYIVIKYEKNNGIFTLKLEFLL